MAKFVLLVLLFARNYTRVKHEFNGVAHLPSFFLGYIVFFALINMSQSTILNQNNIFWILFVYCLTYHRYHSRKKSLGAGKAGSAPENAISTA